MMCNETVFGHYEILFFKYIKDELQEFLSAIFYYDNNNNNNNNIKTKITFIIVYSLL